jgi:hypothetical protein
MTTEPSLDQALAAWAKTEPAGAGDEAALARILRYADSVATPARPNRRPLWMAGSAVAATVAIALLLAPNSPSGPAASSTASDQSPVILAEATTDTTAAFELLYTPTTEEEYQL